jgi:Leucine-rich repeat (LRR) protein
LLLNQCHFQLIVNNCPNLETLIVENTGISKIPHDIGVRLPSLRILDLEDNESKAIPAPSISTLLGGMDLVCLDIRGNSLEDPLQHIIDEGRDAIFKYLQDNRTSFLPSGIAVTSTDSSNAGHADAPQSVRVVPVLKRENHHKNEKESML